MLGLLFGVFNIVPSDRISDLALPPVSCDIYYGTRVRDVTDNIPKHLGAVASYVGLALPVMQVLALPGKRLPQN
ncbi:hypothetical protein [Shimia sp. R11_0]|uniref:hypothetical protein n=1 Tax=Shimia sp. R11_0 TaxID=2821096 RepID=UPI001FFE12A3|nr:hypothetical protein [Shimia sp. R11_0]